MAITYDGGLTCSLRVTDLECSIAWYTQQLGFTLLYRAEAIGWCELSTGVDKVNIGLSESEEAGGAGGSTLTFGVTDLDAARADLLAAGVQLDGEIRVIPDLVRLQTFFDPDGNALMFYQVPANA